MIINEENLAKLLGKTLSKPSKDADRLIEAIQELTAAYVKSASKEVKPPKIDLTLPPAEVTVNLPEEKPEKPKTWTFKANKAKNGEITIVATCK